MSTVGDSRGPGLALAAGLVLAGLLAGACARRGEPSPVAGESGRTISICFAEPRVEPPSPEVHARVAGLTAGVPEPDRAWIRALMTHESAGVAEAVSPTGCAGPLAIQRCPGCTPCCVSDERDRSARAYDRCDDESRHGFRCGAGDPRFSEGYSIDYARRRIDGLRLGLAELPVRDYSFRAALALKWNAGPGAVHGFPAGLRDPVSAVERLDFGNADPYRGWPIEDRLNKLVEVYDYVAWFDALADYWGAPAEPRHGASRGPAASTEASAERCFVQTGGRFVAAGREPGAYRRLAIRRLRFGGYAEDAVELR